MKKESLTCEEASKLIRYEANTGQLFWKPRPREMFSTNLSFHMWNNRFSEKRAFSGMDKRGYFAGELSSKRYLAHRMAWLLAYGDWPKGVIDHIDGNPSNNRLDNLRDVSQQQNTKSQKLRNTNTSGINGVGWSKSRNKWIAHIKIDGKYKGLGYFDSLDAAAIARREADFTHGFSERHGEKIGAAG